VTEYNLLSNQSLSIKYGDTSSCKLTGKRIPAYDLRINIKGYESNLCTLLFNEYDNILNKCKNNNESYSIVRKKRKSPNLYITNSKPDSPCYFCGNENNLDSFLVFTSQKLQRGSIHISCYKEIKNEVENLLSIDNPYKKIDDFVFVPKSNINCLYCNSDQPGIMVGNNLFFCVNHIQSILNDLDEFERDDESNYCKICRCMGGELLKNSIENRRICFHKKCIHKFKSNIDKFDLERLRKLSLVYTLSEDY
jgi:hypothetical protein